MTAGRTDARRLLVLGGTSEIGLAIAAEMAAAGTRDIALVGRDRNGLARAADRLRASGARRVEALELDARQTGDHGAVLRTAFSLFGGFEVVVLAVGVLGARGGLPDDIERELDVLIVNAVGAGSLLLHSARLLAEQGGGTIVALSSAAGIRPRRTNAIYGASKAALDGLAHAIGDALAPSGVRVMVVRPGFVRTRMTHGLPPAPLSVTPERVAKATLRGLRRGAHTVWVPAALGPAMTLARVLPRPLFRRLSL